jgi:hypothetical protein
VLGGELPRPLPVQALDHATGYLLAASACRALTVRARERRASYVRTSLARVARLLVSLGDADPTTPPLARAQIERWLEPAETGFGPVRRVRCPGEIAGSRASWALPAGPLGEDPPAWICEVT